MNFRVPILVLTLITAASPVMGFFNRPAKPSVIGGPGNTPEAQQKIKSSSFPKLDKLDTDTRTLDADTIAAAARFKKLSSDMSTWGNRLAVPGQVYVILADIEKQLEAARTGARILENVEATKTQAKNFLKTVEPALAKIKTAKEKALAISKVTTPLSRKAKSLAMYSGYAATGFQSMSDKALKHEPDITHHVRYSLIYTPERYKSCLRERADAMADEADKLVLAADKAIKPLLATYSPDIPAITGLKNFIPNFDPLDRLQDEAERLRSALKPVCEQLERLNGDIKIDVGVHKIKIPIGRILNKALSLEEYIKDKFTGVVWKAIKLFGLDKLMNKLISAAEHVAEEVANKANLRINLSIDVTALNNLQPRIPTLSAAFPGSLKIADINFANPFKNFPTVPGLHELYVLNEKLRNVTLYGYIGEMQGLEFTAPSFGCESK